MSLNIHLSRNEMKQMKLNHPERLFKLMTEDLEIEMLLQLKHTCKM